jgi:hypothetical protein
MVIRRPGWVTERAQRWVAWRERLGAGEDQLASVQAGLERLLGGLLFFHFIPNHLDDQQRIDATQDCRSNAQGLSDTRQIQGRKQRLGYFATQCNLSSSSQSWSPPIPPWILEMVWFAARKVLYLMPRLRDVLWP